MTKTYYRTEQSDNKQWWYTIQYTDRDPMGTIVGHWFECRRTCRDQTREFRRLQDATGKVHSV